VRGFVKFLVTLAGIACLVAGVIALGFACAAIW
jgi:hypothetical protein